MSFWCLQFLPKNERKQVDLSSKVEFFCSFFGRNVGLKKSFRLCLTFNMMAFTGWTFWLLTVHLLSSQNFFVYILLLPVKIWVFVTLTLKSPLVWAVICPDILWFYFWRVFRLGAQLWDASSAWRQRRRRLM